MKQEYRARFLLRRNSLSAQEIAEQSYKICERIIQLPQFIECNTIFTYKSFGSEVDTNPLIEHAWETGKKVYVPKVKSKNKMDFYRIEKGQPLEKSAYGILEPADKSGLTLPDEKTMFIIPGLVFDKNGYRIGYGAGYYDFYLAECEVLAKVGVCFDFQLIDDVCPDEYDIPVSVIVTEKDIY